MIFNYKYLLTYPRNSIHFHEFSHFICSFQNPFIVLPHKFCVYFFSIDLHGACSQAWNLLFLYKTALECILKSVDKDGKDGRSWQLFQVSFPPFILARASIKQMDDFSGSQTGFSIQNFEGKGKVG